MSVARLAPPDPWATFVWACHATWRELAPLVALSLGWLASAVPLATAWLTGEDWLVSLAVLPLLLGTTGFVGGLAPVAEGGSVRLPGRHAFDPLLAAVAWVWCLAVGWALDGGAVGMLVASTLGALAALVLPLAFAYGAVRARRGLGALRGGMAIAVTCPTLALTLAAGACLAAFACVATAGALLVVAPALITVAACRGVRMAIDPRADGVPAAGRHA